ncbi:threonine/serine exporter family protein [Intestinimonas butyriciproducens]|uniref:Integral membrane protein n=3 Tax=Intestinimonas butyriciproducens TaxID=1297617 RepID=A0A0S2VZX5_9FIRM|nr:threonine/serine exporter family protein [Intestinimonas butyriciproducens]ALP92654.1 Integral membrane protein [Intestinimonas butyriciproducens]MCB7049948.1 threonine/serine exporter family protein [Intestinimonas butyriciproducens]
MDYDKLLTLSGELGYHLLLSGAEIYRVEESVRYLLQAYGVGPGEVFAIPNCIIVGISSPGQKPLTRMRRVGPHGTNVRKIEALNALCRRLCAETPDLDQAWEALQTAAADQTYFSTPQQLSAYFLGTAAFCLFFGGTLADAAASGLCGVAIGVSLIFMSRLGTNLFFKTIAGGFVSALAAVVLVALGLGTHINLIIIGAIMALAPGVVITNFMRDIMAGDMLSGLSKFAEALLTGAGIALGTGLALSLARMLGGAA